MRCNYSDIASRLIPAYIKPGAIVLLVLLLLQACQKSNDDPEKEKKNVDLELIAENLVSPVQAIATHNSNRLYIVDQIGKIWVIDGSGNLRSTPMLDISNKVVPLNPDYDERGLLGVAIHKDFKTNGRIFVHYQLPPRAGGPVPGASWNNISRVSEFHVSPDGSRADPNSEKVILEWDDPQSNHNGGSIAFGADNYLYIAIGDGGGANDVGPGHVDDWYTVNSGGNAQNIEANFLGKILCIDIDHGSPYEVPATNPYVGKPGLDEIFCFGFRNPYRMTFDEGGSHQMIVSDAGQELYEEINDIVKGGNYGWNVREGKHCFSTVDNKKELATCPTEDNRGKPLLDPVIELNNFKNPKGGKATTIIGGYVYRGTEIKGWDGKYIFGSFSQSPTTANGELFMADVKDDRGASTWDYKEVSLKSHPDDLGYYIRGFGQDDDGEVYVCVSSMSGPQGTTGKVYKLVAVE
ncbi:PQQ-dependent sugar dehydrogenase [Niastella sp. OAS944]|uniref:PQQ-dependent sugar dehydrogenase n=1 Tax=Niastella sp. OAS944 TaxID=2664089 RepID=UPI0034896F3F|nr:glucose/arabinose dehydrogenase [Chitinophagaceae bacterium OAS944]